MDVKEPDRTRDAEASNTAKEKAAARCMSCGADSQSRPLLGCLVKGQSKWVCVRCLPMLIHGSE